MTVAKIRPGSKLGSMLWVDLGTVGQAHWVRTVDEKLGDAEYKWKMRGNSEATRGWVVVGAAEEARNFIVCFNRALGAIHCMREAMDDDDVWREILILAVLYCWGHMLIQQG